MIRLVVMTPKDKPTPLAEICVGCKSTVVDAVLCTGCQKPGHSGYATRIATLDNGAFSKYCRLSKPRTPTMLEPPAQASVTVSILKE